MSKLAEVNRLAAQLAAKDAEVERLQGYRDQAREEFAEFHAEIERLEADRNRYVRVGNSLGDRVAAMERVVEAARRLYEDEESYADLGTAFAALDAQEVESSVTSSDEFFDRYFTKDKKP